MMLHEVRNQRRLLGEIHACLRPSRKLLLAEPKIHVPDRAFEKTVVTAEELGFGLSEEPWIRWCRAVVLAKL